jgi:hypothetical protein
MLRPRRGVELGETLLSAPSDSSPETRLVYTKEESSEREGRLPVQWFFRYNKFLSLL